MPSLRKRVTSYFRQLSFHNEPRDKRPNLNENSFVTKYLQGQIKLREGPPVISGKSPTDLPNYDLGTYGTGPDTIIGCYTGPNGGLTTVRRTEKHLSVTDPDIDFIDTQDDMSSATTSKAVPNKNVSIPIDNTTMVIKVAGHEYRVTNRKKQQVKSQSLGSLSDFNIEIETTKIIRNSSFSGNSNDASTKSLESVGPSMNDSGVCDSSDFEKISVCDLVACENASSVNSVPKRRGSSNDKTRVESVDRNKANNKGRNMSNTQNIVTKLCSDIQDQVIDDSSKRRSITQCDKSEGGRSTVRAREKTDSASMVKNTASQKYTHSEKKRQNDNVKLNNHSSVKSNADRDSGGYTISKSKSESNPFGSKKKGRIIKISHRPANTVTDNVEISGTDHALYDSVLPNEWNLKSDHVYGLSDSLYDQNQITKLKNGDPIADCFGIISREDSAILAVADGVNWGEKAAIAAKSAVHGCLHYLNKTIFNDVKVFERLVKTEDLKDLKCETPLHETHIRNTQEVLVCLLRAFNCAHDLILENNGMLTTLTVAVILPLKQNNIKARVIDLQKGEESPMHRTNNTDERKQQNQQNYICCVCNVGDTLAYVYSQKYGIRELTKGSHDINCNRDMRDALGALGPVDGINPELSNLTLSLTKIQKGDIVMIASDGLTDNFDPNVCKFTVNTNMLDVGKPRATHVTQNVIKSKDKHVQTEKLSKSQRKSEMRQHHVIQEGKKTEGKSKPPVKPPRRNYVKNNKDNISRSSTEKSTKSESEENRNLEFNAQRIKTSNDKSETHAIKEKEYAGTSSVVSLNKEMSTSTNSTSSESPKRSVDKFSATVHLVSNIESNFVQETNTQVDVENHQSNKDVNSLNNSSVITASLPSSDTVLMSNPLIAQFMRENSIEEKSLEKCRQSLRYNSEECKAGSTSGELKSVKKETGQKLVHNPITAQNLQHSPNKSLSMDKNTNFHEYLDKKPHDNTGTQSYKFFRSKTSLDLRAKFICRNEDGIPFVTPMQRYELTLLLMEDILRHGISGRDLQCVTAKNLCENLMSFTHSITAGKRHTLEDNEFYYDNRNGIMVEVSSQEKKIRRKRGLERVQNLPGKLDHVTVVGYNVGNISNLSSQGVHY